MGTISVGEVMELVAARAAVYAAGGASDLEDRVSALADELEPLINAPMVNVPRYFEALFERLDAAAVSLAAVDENKRGQPTEDELQRQRLFFAALAEHFHKRLDLAA
ncbi:hypothetical protein [Methylopila sp. 73B]|uniref:hypothetical protein n=1 Tax=Methylopila sp. 73B TaxID=1120792 RepID=UPI00037E5EFE|nr:hypothetical protein [Methylopila sp. 73B]